MAVNKKRPVFMVKRGVRLFVFQISKAHDRSLKIARNSITLLRLAPTVRQHTQE